MERVAVNQQQTKKQFWYTIVIFLAAYLMLLCARQYGISALLNNGYNSFKLHAFVHIVVNILIIILSFIIIKRNRLQQVAGLRESFTHKIKWLLFPLVYMAGLNLLFSDEIRSDLIIPNLLMLVLYTLSIGLAEEISMRGALQGLLMAYLPKSRKGTLAAILLTSVFFGLLHLIKYTNGIYGEAAQVLYAIFIGVMFGALLLKTRSLYPIAIVHAMVDFASKLDTAGMPITAENSNPSSLVNSIITVLLVLPCLLYGLVILKKFNVEYTT